MKKRCDLYIFIIVFLLLGIFLFDGVNGQESGSGDSESEVLVEFGCTNDISVLYDEFRGGDETTDFDALCDNELANIPEMILDNSEFGSIRWLESVDLTQVMDNNVVDLDSNFNNGLNAVFINTSYFFNLARPVEVIFYNSFLTNPRILMNGANCNPPECVISNNGGGELEFSAVLESYPQGVLLEAVQVPQPPRGGGSSGGGSKKKEDFIVNFSIDRELIDIDIKQGTQDIRGFLVTNTGNSSLTLNFWVLALDRFLTFLPDQMFIDPEQTKPVGVQFNIEFDDKPGVYVDYITAYYNESLKKKIRLIMNIIDDNVLFDLKSELESSFIRRNNNIKPSIEMIDLGDSGSVDVNLEYFIKGYPDENKTIKEWKIGEERFIINEHANLDREFSLPKSIKKGDYVFYVKLDYGEGFATSTNPFKIISVNYWWYALILAIILSGAAGFLLYFDNDWRRFVMLISSGTEDLKKLKFRRAVKKYKKLRVQYLMLHQHDRPKGSKRGKEYFMNLRRYAQEQRYREIVKRNQLKNTQGLSG